MSELITNAFNEIDPKNEKFIKKNTDIVEEIYALMKAAGISSQKEFAHLIGKKESEVSKFLSGFHNMTLRSITALEVALGKDIIVTSSNAKKQYEKHSYFVCYKPIEENDLTPFSGERSNYQSTKTKESFELKVA